VEDALLQTKLHVPALRPSFVPRPHLIARLNAGLAGKLILVSAPAGYGKTTLVTEWIRSEDERDQAQDGSIHPSHVAWLSLDEADSDPGRFLAYLIAALQQIQPGLGESVQALLRSPQPPPAEILLTALVNELADVPEPFLLVLDDYHAIHNLHTHQQLAFLMEHQPPRMHLVIMTREDPLIPVSRLRALGQVLEIRQEELRFSLQETAAFLGRVMGLDLSPEDVAALETRTEGWIAGLQLAALSLQGNHNPQNFVQAFTGSNRYILDYLIEEVFKRQPAEVQDFLLKTSILDRLCQPLCDAVIGNPSHGTDHRMAGHVTLDRLIGSSSSQVILEYLDRSNLFVIPLDQSRTWYRYHHLFSELLRLRLHASPSHDEASLHQRASRWYESQALFREAVEHSLSAEDWGNAARLVGAANEGMLKRGEAATLLNWCGRMPRALVCASPQLCMVYAWGALLTSQFAVATPLLEQAERLAEPGSHFLGQVAAAHAFLARAKRDNPQAIAKSEQALALLPDADITTRGNIAMNLGLAYWHEGQLAEAESVLIQAGNLCGKGGNQYALLTTQVFLARVLASRGRIYQAAEMAEQVIQSGGQIPILCLAHYDLAAIHYEWDNLPKALEHFEQGFVLSQRSGNAEFLQAGYLLQAILQHALGKDAEANSALAEADTLASDFPATVRSRVAAYGVQLALACHDTQMLARWQPQVNAEVEPHSFYRFMGLTKSRLLIAQGKKVEAAQVLNAVYEEASRSGWGYGLIVLRILQSLAAKNGEEAVQFLSAALRMGRAENFIRSFVDEGADLVPVLQAVIRRGVEPEYTGRILSALGAPARDPAWKQARQIEALSEREVEVLQLLTQGLSNREIAGKLYISPGTAKTHIHNLCGKLGVRNRTEAAMRAKELGLA
jgi:LuxR family maltose regulon positive regulatory protein